MSGMELRFDPTNQCVWRGDERVDLSPKELLVLGRLVEGQGSLVTKNQLMQAAWPDTFVGDAVLTVVIKQLRDLFDDDARKPWLIETVHRRGFRLLAKVALASVTPASMTPAAGDSQTSPLAPLGGATADFVPPVSLVGREAVLHQLADCWSKACQGQRQLVFVTGEPGIGKTAVLDAFEAMVQQDADALVSRGQCLETYGSCEAYLPVLEAVEGLLRDTRAHGMSELLRLMSPSWLLQFPWLLSEKDRLQLPGQMQGATRERMLRELCAVIEKQSEAAPLALLLEDLHWSDPSTVATLSLLAGRRHAARLLILGTYRSVEVAQAAHPLLQVKHHLQSSGQCIELSLEGLRQADVRRFLEARLDGAVGASAVELLHERSNGNPFFLASLLAQLREQGALRQRQGVWHAAHGTAIAEQVPTDVREVIHQRLDQLPEADVAVLEAASVVGAEFSSTALAACAEQDVIPLEEACERLTRRDQVLRRLDPVAQQDGRVSARYAFHHALLQNELYQRIAPLRRMEAHRRLGLWGEANAASAGELAHHFAMAGVETLDKAIAYAEEAANRATALCAHEEAVLHRQAALHAARQKPQPQRECELLVNLAEAQQRAGQIATAETTFFEAAALARKTGDAKLLARAAIGIGQGYPRSQADRSLIDLLEEALRGLGEEDQAARAMVMSLLDVGLGTIPGGEERRMQLAREAIAIARRLGDASTLAKVIWFLRAALHGPRIRAEFLAEAKEIATLLPELTDVELALQVWRVQVADLIEAGEVEDARARLAQLATYAEDAQILSQLWLVALLQAQLALLCGEMEKGQAYLQQAVELGLRTEHPNVMQLTAGYRVAMMVSQGRLQDLEPLLRMALAQNPNVPSWRAVMGYICAKTGNLPEAREHFEWFAKKDFADIAKDSVWFVFMTFAAMVCHALGDAKRAVVMYAQLLPHAEHSIGHPGAPSAGHMGRYLGLLAAAASKPRDAAQHFTRAIEHNDKVGAKPFAALTRLDFAEHLLQQGTATAHRQAQELLKTALKTAREIGMDGWLPRIEKAHALSKQAKPR